MNEDVYEQVKTQFGKTAQAYVTSTIHAKGEDLEALLELAGDVQNTRVLDVATGGGHTALAFARAGATVTATDLTPEMLQAAEAHLKEWVSITFQEANAEQLPFEPQTFEIVTCRIAAHHFAKPQAFVQEAARVLVPNGLFLLVDNVAPEDAGLAETMNHIERTRDPSHVRAHGVKTWVMWLSEAGLEPYHLSRFRRTKNFSDWTSYAQTPDEVVEKLEAYVLALPEPFKRYFEVIERGRRLHSLSHEVVLLAAKKLRTA